MCIDIVYFTLPRTTLLLVIAIDFKTPDFSVNLLVGNIFEATVFAHGADVFNIRSSLALL